MTKILIADDMPDIRLLLGQLLQREGYAVVAAEDGKQALELAAAEVPDVVLLDIMMPEMDGLEACRRLKADPALRAIPVIMLTARAGDRDIICGLDAGADDYVTKPFKAEVLAARVRSAVRIKESSDRLTRVNAQLREEMELRKQMQDELARAHRLESIGRLAAGLAHEINTPTQYISNNLHFVDQAFASLQPLLQEAQEALQGRLNEPTERSLDKQLVTAFARADVDYLSEEIPRALRESQEGVEQIARIVRSMNSFAGHGDQDETAVDVNQIIQSTVIVCRSQCTEVAEVVLELDPYLPPYRCLPSEISEVVFQLLNNAIQAVADRPTDAPSNPGRITIRTRSNAQALVIEVEDNGVGIREDIAGRVFEPFFTTREVGRGAGQGLTACHAIVVRRYGGSLRFHSSVGRGSTFVVELGISSPTVADGESSCFVASPPALTEPAFEDVASAE